MGRHERITAGVYTRISQDAEERGLGVARQRQDCTALADSKGWQVAEVYEDNDISASSGKPRPAYQRMARDVEAGCISGVVVWDVDRLTRTPRELEDVIDWAEKHSLQLASVGGEIDLSTPQGRMTARIKGTVARHEVEQLSRRIRRKHRELAEKGAHHGLSFVPGFRPPRARPSCVECTRPRPLQESDTPDFREDAERSTTAPSPKWPFPPPSLEAAC